MGTIMKIRHYTQHHITFSLARSGALLMLLLLFSIGYLQPGEVNAAAITCSAGVSGCHFAPTTTPMIKDGTGRNTPTGRFTGSHARHSGYSTSSAKRQYQYACTVCHGLAGGYNNAHQTGFKNVSSSNLPGNRYSAGKKIANTNSPAFGNCGNINCHSSGRSGGSMGQSQYSSVRWGGTKTCLGCHGGRNGANPARSVGNFTLTTSHSQHLKYPAANINCQICHSKTATDAATLKNFTGVQRHANGVRDVRFTNIGYASYTSYKSSEAGSSANTKVCTNTSCHGGKTRSAWSASTNNTDHQCAHCHGTAGTLASTPVTGANRYNLRFFAPGYKKTGTTGTSTDQNVNSNDLRVGSHFKHLSSVYMKNIKCNECHKVPSTPFSADTNHTLNTLRYNSATLDFSQSSSARILVGVASGSTPAQYAAFIGYTNGTAVKASTCSSVYCHGSRLKTSDTSGSYRKPYWNYSAMINYSNPNQACARCHGNPPTTGTAAGDHAAYVGQPTTSCSGCHAMVVNAAGTIIDKTLHINGQVNASGGHEWSFGGLKHKNGGTGSKTANPTSYSNCTGCHSLTGGGSYPVVRGVAANINCQICHTNQANFTSTPGCGDCHGTNANGGQPNGAANAFPNWSGSHSNHIAQSFLCADCHLNAGSGYAIHGNYSGKAAKTRTTVNVKFNTAKSGTAATYTAASLTCTTSTCHGQKSPAWGSATPSPSCVRCHGYQSLATLNNYTQNSIAPGTGNIDTNRTTGVTARGGMHQEHLKGTTGIGRNVRCIECHVSTTNVNHASLDNMTTAAVTFSGVATALSHTTASVSRVSGIINCSNNECHHGGARADGTGAGQSGIATRTLPKWNDSALLGNTTIADTCTGKCHNMPPGGAVATDTHSGLTASGTYTTPAQLATACSSCHSVISSSATTLANLWTDHNLHVNGVVNASSGCTGCHTALTAADFVKPSRHVNNGTTTSIVTDFDCIVCHAEGVAQASGVTRSDLHTGTGTTTGNVDLRNVDNVSQNQTGGTSGTNYYPWPHRRASAALAKGSANTTYRNNMDTFCLNCHDDNGASGIAVNNSNNGLLLSALNTTVRTVTSAMGGTNANPNNATVAQRPFNTEDNLRNGNDAATAGNGSSTIGAWRTSTYGRVLNVKSQFNSGGVSGTAWASHHNLNQYTKRYTSNSTVAGTGGITAAAWTGYVTKESVTMNGTTGGTLAGLHCSDCHLNEVNAHGTTNAWYMLMNVGTVAPFDETGDNAPTTSGATSAATVMTCNLCHANSAYSPSGTGIAAAHYPHNPRCQNVDVVTGTAIEAPFGNNCHGCHGGYGNTADTTNQDSIGTGTVKVGRGALGTIHGNNESYNPASGATASKRYRFMSGATMRFYNPNNTTAYSGTANWESTTAAGCYTISSGQADTWAGGCTSHSGGGTGQTKNSGRLLTY